MPRQILKCIFLMSIIMYSAVHAHSSATQGALVGGLSAAAVAAGFSSLSEALGTACGSDCGHESFNPLVPVYWALGAGAFGACIGAVIGSSMSDSEQSRQGFRVSPIIASDHYTTIGGVGISGAFR